MKKQSKKIINILLATTIFTAALFTATANAANLSLFGNTLVSKVQPNCIIRREYNDFMRQWTDNEICNPRVYDIDTAQGNGGVAYSGQSAYYYAAPSTSNFQSSYSGYYTGNNNAYTGNTWGGYGNATNYLLGSFGGGYGGGYGGSLTSPYFNYGSYTYPNSVYNYTPTLSEYFDDRYEPFYSDYSVYSAPYNNFNYNDGAYGLDTYTVEDYSGNNSVTYCPDCNLDELDYGASNGTLDGYGWGSFDEDY